MHYIEQYSSCDILVNDSFFPMLGAARAPWNSSSHLC